jgi:hypothetical protein
LLDSHGPARVKAVGGYADLRAHTELGSIGELRRSVVQYDGAVDSLEEVSRWAAFAVMMLSVCDEPYLPM